MNIISSDSYERPNFDKSLLFKKPGLNTSTSNQWNNKGRGGYGGANRSFSIGSSYGRNSGGRGGPNLIFIQLIAENTIGLLFQNFFDYEIKDKIKSLPESKYEAEGNLWCFRKERINEVIDAIGELCIKRMVQLVDIPEFVYNFVKYNVPFATSSKKAKGFKIDYSAEVKKKYDLKQSLPAIMLNSLYDF